MVKIIAAIDIKNGIGKDLIIPWRCREDMDFFREETTNHVVVMGTKTRDSLVLIDRFPLKNRVNIVLSRSLKNPDFVRMGDIDFSLYEEQGKHVFIVGGEQVYRSFFESGKVDEVILSRIDLDGNCNKFFPMEFLDGFYKEQTLFIDTEEHGELAVEIYKKKFKK